MQTASQIQDVGANSFATEVLASPVPVLVEYWAQWCAPCRMMAPLLEESARTYRDQIAVVRVNVDDDPALASRYHVRSIPTMMIFRDGAPVTTQVGAVNRSRLEQMIEAQLRTSAAAQGFGAAGGSAPSTGRS